MRVKLTQATLKEALHYDPALTGTKEELKQLLRSKGLTETQITIETAGVADGQTPNRSNTMTMDLMIPNAADVPAYLRNPELARQANEEAAAGIGTGFPPRIKLNGKAFALVDGNGDETSIPPDKMFAGPDQMYLPVIVLRAKKALQKTWYATAFNPAAEPVAPDCFSTDYERPDPSASAPQSELCASCPMNAYGSGKDQAGNPTAGKACADTKVLAVYV
ncbi:MAG: hypothetical protein RBR35_17775, partial [Salinivirgaceae bacterium]|nr:hypothetical protein [Salinivirgaceae bacterium]